MATKLALKAVKISAEMEVTVLDLIGRKFIFLQVPS